MKPDEVAEEVLAMVEDGVDPQKIYEYVYSIAGDARDPKIYLTE